jgi:hypothetical protein
MEKMKTAEKLLRSSERGAIIAQRFFDNSDWTAVLSSQLSVLSYQLSLLAPTEELRLGTRPPKT